MSENFQAKIENVYGSLSKGHKKIADYIRSNYEKASFMTAASLGKAVGVSESTVVRFASNIGFDGYPELQKYLQEMVKSHLTSVQRMDVAASRFEGDDMLDNAFAADIEMINKLESDTYFDGDETQKVFLRAIHSLPQKQQMVFNLKYFKEMKYEDISEILGTSIGALKASYHHAVKKIEAFLEKHI